MILVSERNRESVAALRARRAIEFLADPHATARERFRDPEQFREANYPYTCGVALATVGSLLDALGYPEQGPVVNQWSWLPDEDEDDL